MTQISVADQGVGGITILDEMECLWDSQEIAKKGVPDKDRRMLPKRVLFDRSHPLFLSVHPAFVQNSEGSKYTEGMTLVALSMSDCNWNKCVREHLKVLINENCLHQSKRMQWHRLLSWTCKLG